MSLIMRIEFPDEINLKKFKIKTLLPDSTILCLGRRRCLLKNTPVLMYNGNIKKIQDISVGEYVMGDDNFPRQVLECHNGVDDMFKVTHVNDGKTYTVNSAHILTLKDILTNKTIDISVKDYLKQPDYLRNRLCGINSVIEFKDRPADNLYELGEQVGRNVCVDLRVIQSVKYNSLLKRKQFIYGLTHSLHEREIKCNDITIYDVLVYIFRGSGVFCVCDDKKKTIKFDLLKDTSCSKIRVDKCGYGKYYGITIDGNNRYVLGNFVVTHNSGKSWLVRDILYNHKHIPAGVVFSGTEHASPFFSDFVPDSFIHTKYNPELIDQIMIKQRQKIRKAKAENKGNNGKSPENNFFIILDDMLHEAQTWKRDETIKNIFFNGRHYNFMFFLTMQYPLGITPDLRSNIDYVFIFNEPSLKNRKKIYDDYASMIPDFTYFCNILDECTKNHQCLVIKTSGNGLQEQVFWYKAEFHDEFRVGHPKIWEYHRRHYNPEYEAIADKNAERIHSLTKKFNKTKKLKVIVSKTTGDIEECHETDSD